MRVDRVGNANIGEKSYPIFAGVSGPLAAGREIVGVSDFDTSAIWPIEIDRLSYPFTVSTFANRYGFCSVVQRADEYFRTRGAASVSQYNHWSIANNVWLACG